MTTSTTRGCIETVRAERERLIFGLRDLGWKVEQSHANFVFGTPPPGTLHGCVELLNRERVHVRTFARAAHGLGSRLASPRRTKRSCGLFGANPTLIAYQLVRVAAAVDVDECATAIVGGDIDSGE